MIRLRLFIVRVWRVVIDFIVDGSGVAAAILGIAFGTVQLTETVSPLLGAVGVSNKLIADGLSILISFGISLAVVRLIQWGSVKDLLHVLRRSGDDLGRKDLMVKEYSGDYPSIVNAVENRREGGMDFSTFVGVLSSIASIVAFLQKNDVLPSIGSILREYDFRLGAKDSAEARLRVERRDVEAIAKQYLDARDADGLFEERIRNYCLPPYYETIPSGDTLELDRAEARARECVCDSLRRVKRQNGGVFPKDVFWDWWQRWRCDAQW